ncbi:MAG: ATP phosphoribosyltransferase regulatory subunit [Oscillospiraceae bacterium]|nr:ATP phosphoribosyltransferase regulatory subunit [Oscillospiraceae bacterium]
MNPKDAPAPENAQRNLLFALHGLYRACGYRAFRMSKFEKYEVYAACKDFLVSDRVLTFTDTDGELLALKPDVTLSILRAVPYRPGITQRLSYHENVYRPGPPDGRFREMPQSGVECLGDLDSLDVYEVLKLADESLRLLPCETALSFSHLGILRALLNRLSADEKDRDEILRLVAARSVHGLSALFRRRGFPEAVLHSLCELLALDCALEELPDRLREIGAAFPESPVLGELEELAALAEGDGCRARFDFSVLNDTHYYNGLVFRGYARGISDKVLSGGRYDRLLRRMDRPGGAVGFAVYLGLLSVLNTADDVSVDADVLVLYDENTPLTLVRDQCAVLRARGKRVYAQRRLDDSLRFAEVLDLREGGKSRA